MTENKELVVDLQFLDDSEENKLKLINSAENQTVEYAQFGNGSQKVVEKKFAKDEDGNNIIGTIKLEPDYTADRGNFGDLGIIYI